MWGSGDVQPWDSNGANDNQNGCSSEVRFILPGDESTDDDYLDSENSCSSDSDLLLWNEEKENRSKNDAAITISTIVPFQMLICVI